MIAIFHRGARVDSGERSASPRSWNLSRKKNFSFSNIVPCKDGFWKLMCFFVCNCSRFEVGFVKKKEKAAFEGAGVCIDLYIIPPNWIRRC